MNPTTQAPGIIDNIKSGMNNIGETLKTTGSDLTAKLGDVGTNLSSAADTTKASVASGFDAIKSVLPPAPVPSNGTSFSLGDYTTMSSEFLESNSYIARAAFILLVVFMFFVILRLATGAIKYFIGRSEDPVRVVDGMIDGTQSQVITQGFGGKTIYRSNNEETGVEFTWAVSLYIDDQDITNTFSHIFNKGSVPNYTINGADKHNTITTINQAPGLYLNNVNNQLIIKMDSFNQSVATVITVPEIPHKKWLNVIIRCQNKIIDVYINGQVVNSTNLPNVPKQNYGNVYVCQGGGFKGNLSNLLYFRHALTINEIQKSLESSVDIQMAATTGGVTAKTVDYLGFRWYGSN